MIHPTGKCPTHGFALVSMPRDPTEPNLVQTSQDDMGHAVYKPIPGARDSKGYLYKCPLSDCLAGVPKEMR